MNLGLFGLPKGPKPILGAGFNVPTIAAYSNLAIKVATNTTVAVTADAVTMKDPTSGLYLNAAILATVDLSTSGGVNKLDTGAIAINRAYHIWAIANLAGQVGVIASLSATAPTMPIGYTFKARIGSVRTINGSATLYGTWQFGPTVQYVVGLAQTTTAVRAANGISGSVTVPTWVPLTIQGDSGANLYVPSTAASVRIAVTVDANSISMAAPNASYGPGNTGITNTPPIVVVGSSVAGQQTGIGDMLLEAATIQWASNSAGGALFIRGWDEQF